MKNQYTPKEYAFSIAVDSLMSAYTNRLGELDGLTPSEQNKTKAQILKLIQKLANQASLDYIVPTE
jgi:hypothetical protein